MHSASQSHTSFAPVLHAKSSALSEIGCRSWQSLTQAEKSEAHDAFKAFDGVIRKHPSLYASFAELREIGRKRFGYLVLELDFAEQLRSSHCEDALLALLASALVASSIAEHGLACGTPLSEGIWATTPNLDLGGNCLQALYAAEINIEKARAIDRDGRNMAELTIIGAPIRAFIEKILGAHHLKQVSRDLAESFTRKPICIERLRTDIVHKIDRIAPLNGARAQELGAKLFRDLVLIDVAIGKLELERGNVQGALMRLLGSGEGRKVMNTFGQPRGFDGARDEFLLATELRPDNADMAELATRVFELSLCLERLF